MASVPSVLIGDDVQFWRDAHAYIDHDGRRVLSVMQSLKLAGLIDFSMVPPDVLEHARNRGSLVHEACAKIDLGEPLDDVEIPEECLPYIDAYFLFCKEMRYVPDQDWIEKPMTASTHPAWSLQTGGYTLGLRAAGLQIRQRIAVQLLRTGKYKLHPHEDDSDYQSFGDVYRTAALKLKLGLATLD